MNTPDAGNSREGKYCPRCHTMTRRDSETCEHCGHRFRTGLATGLATGLGTGLSAAPPDAAFPDEAARNRTMQFTLPPPAPRSAPAAPPPPPKERPNRRRLALGAAGMAASLALALAYLDYARTAHAVRASPAGVWETAVSARAAQNARLGLTLGADGGGSLSWTVTGTPAPPSVPLRWRLDPDGKLVLSITSPPVDAPDAVPGTLVAILGSHSWLWRVDPARHRLVVGSLSFTEKP